MMRVSTALVSIALVLIFAACSDSNVRRMDSPVVPIAVGETALLSATSLAKAMLRAGFSREEILEYGPAVRNSISMQGGAEVKRSNAIQALFSVHDGTLYVSSRTSGTFAQPIAGVDP